MMECFFLVIIDWFLIYRVSCSTTNPPPPREGGEGGVHPLCSLYHSFWALTHIHPIAPVASTLVGIISFANFNLTQLQQQQQLCWWRTEELYKHVTTRPPHTTSIKRKTINFSFCCCCFLQFVEWKGGARWTNFFNYKTYINSCYTYYEWEQMRKKMELKWKWSIEDKPRQQQK